MVDSSNSGSMLGDGPTLVIDDLAISYSTRRGEFLAVRGVSLDVSSGETFGLVGESGCGKSTIAFGILGFLARNGQFVRGSVRLRGQELVGKSDSELRHLRGNQMAIVPQNSMEALNPCRRIGAQLSETLMVHQGMERSGADRRSREMLERVYMPDPDEVMNRFPHQLSGGQQQRVVIAMALLNSPDLLIMDEPTTALDVTVEAAVLDLVNDLQEAYGTATLYVTHDMGVISRVADTVGVMYFGELMEVGTADQVLNDPFHPYTRGLMRCVPRLGRTKQESELRPIPGRVPSPDTELIGCWFSPRCDLSGENCERSRLGPRMQEVEPEHFVRCFRADQLSQVKWGFPAKTIEENREPAVSLITHGDQILDLEDVSTYYKQEANSIASLFGLGKPKFVKAVDGISLDVREGSTLGIVGESGCGKSTLVRTIVGLEPLSAGEIQYMGFDISKPLQERDLDLIRELQMVFQNPDATLNPSFSVGYQISRSLKRLRKMPRSQIRSEVNNLLNSVKLDESYYNRLPRQLSGGERQRVSIARAFAAHPKLVLCDEPVSSLDVSVQAAVLRLLLEIQRDRGLTMMYISHDLSVVRYLCDYVAVLYLGKICEIGPAESIYQPPYHPYTEALLSAVPIPDPAVKQEHIRLGGSVPSALNPPSGCPFHTRCPRKVGSICEDRPPPAVRPNDEHTIYCQIELDELLKVDAVVHTTENHQVRYSDEGA